MYCNIADVLLYLRERVIFVYIPFYFGKEKYMSLKIAIIGFGFMGQTHAGSLLRIPGTEITGVVDFNDPVEQLKSIKGNNDAVTITVEEASKLPWYKSWEELVSKAGTPDAVIVALPTRFHSSAVVQALESGCHVMVEKPFATSVAECEQMIAAAEKAGKLLAVGYVVRCFAEYNALKEFGKLNFLEMRRFAGIPGWGSWLDPEVVRHSGGTLFDLLSHDLDFALHMLGAPAAVKASRRGKLWDHLGDQRSKGQKVLGVDQGQQLAKLVKDPLPGQPVHQRGQGKHSVEGGRFYGKTVANAEADTP